MLWIKESIFFPDDKKGQEEVLGKKFDNLIYDLWKLDKLPWSEEIEEKKIKLMDVLGTNWENVHSVVNWEAIKI